MLLRITNRCHAGCSHCLIDGSGPNGEHMSVDLVKESVLFAERFGVSVLLVSGGEPFEHPDIERLLPIFERIRIVFFLSNGHFLRDKDKLDMVLRNELRVQVTYDPRYYKVPVTFPEELLRNEDFMFSDEVSLLFPCRRTREAGILSTRESPPCFNLLSIASTIGIVDAVRLLETQGRVCGPSINIDGSVRAGESDTCYALGNICSSSKELNQALREMKCNRCGLWENLGVIKEMFCGA